jgi:hypothetical protein
MKAITYIIIFLLTLASCNYKLLVDKRKVVNTESGYLTFFKNEVVFYPWRDSIDFDFLSKSHNNGFKVNERNIDWLDSISARYPIIVSIETPMMQLPDTISIIPVKIQYYLGDFWDKDSERISLYYYWNGVRYVLSYKLYDYRSILRITAMRRKDVERAIDFYHPN